MSTLEHSVRRIAAVGAVALFVPVAPAAAATVVRVIDGDTVKVRDDGKLRTVDLAGVNAPERGACAGTEARRGLARLLPAGRARAAAAGRRRAGTRALRLPWRPARQRRGAAARTGPCRGHRRAEQASGAGGRRAGCAAAAQGNLEVVRAVAAAAAVTFSPAAVRRGGGGPRALAPTSPTGCSSRSPAPASSTRRRLGCTSAGTATAALDISWSNDASGGSGSEPHRGLVGGRERRVHGDDRDRARSPVQRRRGDVPDLLRTGTARVDRRRRPDPGRLERPVRGPPGRLIAGAGRCSGRVLLVAGAPTVVRVVDGDTLQVRTGASGAHGAPGRRRCAGARGVRERRGRPRAGPAAAARRTRPAAARFRGARRARYVYRRGRLVNAALLRDGAAKPGDTGGLRKRPALLAAAREAEQQRRGDLDGVRAAPGAGTGPRGRRAGGDPARAGRARRPDVHLEGRHQPVGPQRTPAAPLPRRVRRRLLELGLPQQHGVRPHGGLLGGRQRHSRRRRDRARPPVQPRRRDVPHLRPWREGGCRSTASP